MDSGSALLNGVSRSASFLPRHEMGATASPHQTSTRPQDLSPRGTLPQGASKTYDSSSNPGLHSCVVRIRVEDQHLAQDIVEGLESARDRVVMSQLASHVNNLLLTNSPRRSNPSPLGSHARQPSPLMGMIRC